MNLTQEMISRSLYLESGLWKMIDEKAKEDERSGNKTISFILKNYFEKNKKHKTRAKAK
jgi:hypothetical protein